MWGLKSIRVYSIIYCACSGVTYTKMCVCVDAMRQLVGVGSILPLVGVGDGIQVSGLGSMGSSLLNHLTILVSFWLL